MKFVLSPVHKVSEEERKILLQFREALNNACHEVANCDLCPLHDFCQRWDGAPEVLEELLDILGLS